MRGSPRSSTAVMPSLGHELVTTGVFRRTRQHMEGRKTQTGSGFPELRAPGGKVPAQSHLRHQEFHELRPGRRIAVPGLFILERRTPLRFSRPAVKRTASGTPPSAPRPRACTGPAPRGIVRSRAADHPAPGGGGGAFRGDEIRVLLVLVRQLPALQLPVKAAALHPAGEVAPISFPQRARLLVRARSGDEGSQLDQALAGRGDPPEPCRRPRLHQHQDLAAARHACSTRAATVPGPSSPRTYEATTRSASSPATPAATSRRIHAASLSGRAARPPRAASPAGSSPVPALPAPPAGCRARRRAPPTPPSPVLPPGPRASPGKTGEDALPLRADTCTAAKVAGRRAAAYARTSALVDAKRPPRGEASPR